MTSVMRASSAYRIAVLGVASIGFVGCAQWFDAHRSPQPSPSASVGASPQLPEPTMSWIPTVTIAPAVGWPDGSMPTAAPGLSVSRYASGLEHPRWLFVLPDGGVLVAESNAPAEPGRPKGIRDMVQGAVMERAGARTPSANRISLLRQPASPAREAQRKTYLRNLASPLGMALVDRTLYVANADSIVKFPYRPGDDKIESAGEALTDLPAGINHHWTKNLIASPDGTMLYATVGSNSNVGERGMAAEAGRAAIYEVDLATGRKRLFASGLRNPNGMAWAPGTGVLWTVVNERDELGDDLVPDYLTSVKDGGFYGWPWTWFGPDNVDVRAPDPNRALMSRAIAPDYALGAHVAPLGLAASTHNALTPSMQEGMFIGLHGSWNRKTLVGYKVVFVPFRGGRPSGEPVDVLTGFVDAEGRARGRPAGVALATDGALLVADDVGNVVWRVSAAGR